MLNNQTILFIVSAFLSGLILAYLVSYIFRQKEKQQFMVKLTQSDAEISKLQEQLQYLQTFNSTQKQQLNDTFQALSSQVLKQNSESFLQLARESLGQFHQRAQGDFDKKEQAIDALLKPIKDTLEKTHEQIHLMEKERKQAYGSLKEHLSLMAETQKNLHTETRNLVQAFRRPEVRGQWGELTLKRLAELAGMVEHCDFVEQDSVVTEEGKQLRPDMIIKMPAGREIIVDSKTHWTLTWMPLKQKPIRKKTLLWIDMFAMSNNALKNWRLKPTGPSLLNLQNLLSCSFPVINSSMPHWTKIATYWKTHSNIKS